MVCDICKTMMRDYGMMCTPTSCACKCHRKSRTAIERVTGNREIINAQIANAIKRGHGVVQEGTKFKYNNRQEERR